eukprot:1917229-Rhodomonas_salina.1
MRSVGMVVPGYPGVPGYGARVDGPREFLVAISYAKGIPTIVPKHRYPCTRVPGINSNQAPRFWEVRLLALTAN